MELESFAKLIYIGQNNICALRDSPKAEREQHKDRNKREMHMREGEAALAKFAFPVKQLAETEAGFEEVERKKKEKEEESARLGEESTVLLSQKGLSDSTSADAIDKVKSTASRFFAVFLVAAVL